MMENNNYNNSGNQGGTYGAGGTQGTDASQETNSTYGYSYVNQEQKNPNNIWRADENTSSSNAGGSANSHTQADAAGNASSAYGSAAGTSNIYGNAQQSTDGTYNNAQQSTDSTYSNVQQNAENAYSSIYGTPNSQSGWNTYSDARKQKKEERARRRAKKYENTGTNPNFGIKLAKCASIALIFGLVAGTAFEGSSYVMGNLIGTKANEADTVSNPDKEVLSTSGGQEAGSQLASATSSTGDGVVAIVEQCMPSIVAITNMTQKEYQNWFGQVQRVEVPSAGSGVIVSEDDNYLYIATNNHVVASATTLTIQFNDGTTASAEIKGTDVSTDLAVVQVRKSDVEASTLSSVKVAALGDSDSIKVGSQAIAIGNALGYGQSVTAGYISAKEREVTFEDESTRQTFTNKLIQTDAAINPGNSGGALLNSNGEVIGINSSKYSDTDVEGMGFAIPSNVAKPIIEDLITKQVVTDDKAAFLGIQGEPVPASVTEAFNIPEGVFIREITKGSSAEEYGLQKGDIITGFEGRSIRTMEDLQKRISYCEAGTEVEITIQRQAEGGYQESKVKVVLGKRES